MSRMSRVVLMSLVVLLALAGGCSSDHPSYPQYFQSAASVDSIWLAAVHGRAVTLGLTGRVPDTCSEFWGGTVSFAQPDSYFVTPQARRPRNVICEYFVSPYIGQVNVTVPPGAVRMLVRAGTSSGESRVWEISLP
jgi:hypothetical protein